MAEAAERKLRDAMDIMLDDIDKSYMRRMQVREERACAGDVSSDANEWKDTGN